MKEELVIEATLLKGRWSGVESILSCWSSRSVRKALVVLPILYFCGCTEIITVAAESSAALELIGVPVSQQREIGRMVFAPVGKELSRSLDQIGVDLDSVGSLGSVGASVGGNYSGNYQPPEDSDPIYELAYAFNEASNAFFQSIVESLPPPERFAKRGPQRKAGLGRNRF